MLKGKKILLGITASIAAYKSAQLVRLLIREGAEVQAVMTPMASEFITPVTLSALTSKPVLSQFIAGSEGTWNSHVELGLWADLFLVAPVTACTLGKMANGIADNLLIATYLSCKCPVMLAPAMDLDMYQHPSTARNLEILRTYGNQVIEPATGELASGLYGKGRMEEPEMIMQSLSKFFSGAGSVPGEADASGIEDEGRKKNAEKKKTRRLKGKRILITAGPTHERIDPVRYLGNYSSGKMGIALAEACAKEGAEVRLVCGPVEKTTNLPGVQRIDVRSAEEMAERCFAHFPGCHAAIMTAAVADYTPVARADHKMKRGNGDLELQLKPTTDIAASLGKRKQPGQILAGFALETENAEANAMSKLRKKNFDFIVLNSLDDEGAGFGHDTNKVSIIDGDNKITRFELKSKTEVAADVMEKLLQYLS